MLSLFCHVSSYTQEVVINEILFNPVKDGFDYVEGYNNSSITIFLNDMMIANRNGANEIASIRNLSKEPLRVEPGNFFIVTANEKWLREKYIVPASAVICQQTSLPSFPDDEGSVILLRKADTTVIDEFSYSEKWHFQLISEREGVALERIGYDLPTQEKNNWTSASSSSGYGTPGNINSQFMSIVQGDAEVSVLPKIFTPNNDGQDDFAFITINIKQQGKIANAVIYDASGRKVRYILKNELLGANNRFIWDGYDDHSQKLATGIYIIFTQIFDLKGNVNKYRNCIVLKSFPP